MAVEINIENIALKELTLDNLAEEHICCAIGNDKTNKARAQQKKEWLKSRFDEGHRFLKADLRGKVFIEYSPACPFNEDFTHIMADIGRDLGFSVRIKQLETREDLALLPTPWGLFSVFLDGEMLSAEVMTANKFRVLLESRKPA